MTAAGDPAFVGDVAPRRRSAQPAPLDAWLRALLALLLLWIGAGLWFVFMRTPMQVEVDRVSFARQLADFDRHVRAAEADGGKPLRVLFLGTSRIRNVTLDSAAVAAAARDAGVKRPLASGVIGINWGGFERYEPVLRSIERRRPDVIVVMPELLHQDFPASFRLQLGLAWLQSRLWGKEFRAFPADETVARVCLGFDRSARERDADDRGHVKTDIDAPGPRLARAFLGRMAGQGTEILVADVPVTPELLAVRKPLPAPGGDGFERVKFGAVDRTAYCDFAHIDPTKADAWRRPFFAAVAAKLNGLGALRMPAGTRH